MKKTLILTALLLCLVFVFCGCTESEPVSESGSSVFGLNETASFEDLKFTATEITENTGTQFLAPDEGNVFVGIKFTIENISDEEQSISSLLLFEPYCDDVEVDYSISAASNFDGNLDGTIAAGKKMIGYYALEVPKEWNTIELEIKSSWLSDSSATFKFENEQTENTPVDTTENTSNSAEELPTATDVPTQKTYGLNETATIDAFAFTATELTESNGTQFIKPDEGKIFVGIKFTIENISTQNESLSSILLFEPYCDDIKAEQSIMASSIFGDSLNGDLSPGKKMIGYYAIEVPTNWSTIELEVKGDWMSNNSATFSFTK